jgi:uncharacterized protein YPO0396
MRKPVYGGRYWDIYNTILVSLAFYIKTGWALWFSKTMQVVLTPTKPMSATAEQTAQFTYAILGAAIAHQFGIYEAGKQHRSLRFITVDEAFSKLDPQKSQFLMEFCAQLNLQLLIVTPLDKINIAEPYINAVHYVEIKNQKNSLLYNLTMDEYQEKKEAFKQLAETNDDYTERN